MGEPDNLAFLSQLFQRGRAEDLQKILAKEKDVVTAISTIRIALHQQPPESTQVIIRRLAEGKPTAFTRPTVGVTRAPPTLIAPKSEQPPAKRSRPSSPNKNQPTLILSPPNLIFTPPRTPHCGHLKPGSVSGNHHRRRRKGKQATSQAGGGSSAGENESSNSAGSSNNNAQSGSANESPNAAEHATQQASGDGGASDNNAQSGSANESPNAAEHATQQASGDGGASDNNAQSRSANESLNAAEHATQQAGGDGGASENGSQPDAAKRVEALLSATHLRADGLSPLELSELLPLLQPGGSSNSHSKGSGNSSGMNGSGDSSGVNGGSGGSSGMNGGSGGSAGANGSEPDTAKRVEALLSAAHLRADGLSPLELSELLPLLQPGSSSNSHSKGSGNSSGVNSGSDGGSGPGNPFLVAATERVARLNAERAEVDRVGKEMKEQHIAFSRTVVGAYMKQQRVTGDIFPIAPLPFPTPVPIPTLPIIPEKDVKNDNDASDAPLPVCSIPFCERTDRVRVWQPDPSPLCYQCHRNRTEGNSDGWDDWLVKRTAWSERKAQKCCISSCKRKGKVSRTSHGYFLCTAYHMKRWNTTQFREKTTSRWDQWVKKQIEDDNPNRACGICAISGPDNKRFPSCGWLCTLHAPRWNAEQRGKRKKRNWKPFFKQQKALLAEEEDLPPLPCDGCPIASIDVIPLSESDGEVFNLCLGCRLTRKYSVVDASLSEWIAARQEAPPEARCFSYGCTLTPLRPVPQDKTYYGCPTHCMNVNDWFKRHRAKEKPTTVKEFVKQHKAWRAELDAAITAARASKDP
ncbi:hypothetical protein K438DRAFT_1956625 [Mycena galopus ATCC 62051]|nr:hypothetical protein K438DRAFT_1956625 [Mycena galopus ATCC 62051]